MVTFFLLIKFAHFNVLLIIKYQDSQEIKNECLGFKGLNISKVCNKGSIIIMSTLQ